MQTLPARFLTVLAACAALGASGAALAEKVRLATSAGDIVVELDAQKSPKTVANFVQYVRSGHYDGTIFHRVIDNFMIQGGGRTVDGTEKPTRPPIALESQSGLTHQRGTIAMARTSDPNSATAQFFINVKENDRLNSAPGKDGYAVFGKVIEGMDVVDRIKVAPTGAADVPLQPIVIKKATVEK